MAEIQLRSEIIELLSLIKAVNIEDLQITGTSNLLSFHKAIRKNWQLKNTKGTWKLLKGFVPWQKTYCEWDSNPSSCLKVVNAQWLTLVCHRQMMLSQYLQTETQRGVAEPSCSGKGVARMGSLWLWSEARDSKTTALHLQEKGPRNRILSTPTSQPIDATYRSLPCCSQKLSQEHTNISQGNLENLHTLGLQPGRGSPGYRFPDGFKVGWWEVEVRIWKKWSSRHSPSHPATAPETTRSLGEKTIRGLLVEMPLSVSWLHNPWTWRQQHYNRFKGFSSISHLKR